ncbi:MAG TPA: helix-turn-helix transcriptional regulator [Bacteroidales bacterium]|nr:helix-turn-helix transcriptional regulator [Bacteroidales bacterium]
MLRLRLRYLFNSKGISNPYSYMRKLRFSSNVATRLLNDYADRIELSRLEVLCTKLNCTPNDLLEYIPSPENPLYPGHSLEKLIRNEKEFSIVGELNHLSVDQIKEVEQFISKIKNNGEVEK